ncbi:MAG TPA: hypothetical protein VMS16_00195 [Mycobacterium sp.]|jgi:hypothetical protein|nr:hypothetical protein [Mycobacterium sp.]
MVALAVVLLIAGLILLAVGFVLFANGTGAAPHQRTEEDPTGIKRATSRTSWGGVFRHLPTNVRLLAGQKASHEDKLAAAGSLLLLIGIGALCLAALSVIVAYV